MNQKKAVIDCYNRGAKDYAEHFLDELEGKSLDRILLKRFAEENKTKGLMLDLACGPGQTTRFMHQNGVKELLGLDLAPEMIKVANQTHAEIKFIAGDMLALPFEQASVGSAICFYGIVHFNYAELADALKEVLRILKSGGQFLFSFHIGDTVERKTDFLGHEVVIDFQYFEVEQVKKVATELGWQIKEIVERHPYEGAEYPSKRAYFLLGKP